MQTENLSLSETVTHLLEECRMVLPGIQALFGFQLIAVFNTRFGENLTRLQQIVHLIAIGLVSVSVILVMTPAAIHRKIGPEKVTDTFILLASRLLMWSMFPLALGICLDFYVITHLIANNEYVSLFLTITLSGIFILFWFVLPELLLNKESNLHNK